MELGSSRSKIFDDNWYVVCGWKTSTSEEIWTSNLDLKDSMEVGNAKHSESRHEDGILWYLDWNSAKILEVKRCMGFAIAR